MVEMFDSEIKEWLLTAKENELIEFKESKTSLPKNFWDTYSAFANSNGGFIFLGIKEGKDKNEIIGIEDVEKIKKDLWNQAENKEKVSYCAITNNGIFEIDFDGHIVLGIKIEEAPDNEKPVYLRNNIENSYYRSGDGDRHMSKDQLKIMLRTTMPEQDSMIAKGIKFADLDIRSINRFKDIVSMRYPNKEFDTLSVEEFLIEIGAADTERGDVVYKKGTVLFLGKVNAIKKIYPKYHVDYFNYKGSSRWVDRVCDDEPNDVEMNLFNFYYIVSDKLHAIHQQSFELNDSIIRKPMDNYLETLREGLVNCLAHADYISGQPSIKVEVYDGWNRFINPGELLISVSKFFVGGDSRPRNEIVMKLFRLIGESERQGFGGKTIYANSISDNYRLPEIESTVEYTELKVWNSDIADSYPELDENDRKVLRFLYTTGLVVSIQDLMQEFYTTDYSTRKSVNKLMEMGLVNKIGSGPNTRYAAVLGNDEIIGRLQLAINRMGHNI